MSKKYYVVSFEDALRARRTILVGPSTLKEMMIGLEHTYGNISILFVYSEEAPAEQPKEVNNGKPSTTKSR